MNMLIGVDAGCLGIQDERLKGGVYQIAVHLLQILGRIDKKNTYLLYSFYPIDKALISTFGKNMRNVVVKPVRGWMKLWIPLQMHEDKIDIFLGLNQALPQNIPLFSRYKSIVIFYDLAFEKLPFMYAYAGSLKKLHAQSIDAAKHADKIITISKTTKLDIEELYDIPSERISVAYPGIDKKYFNASKIYKTKNPYFLFVGAFKKTKNMPTLIKAFAFFLKQTNLNYSLILAGGDKWLDPDISEAMDELPQRIKNKIQFLDFVDDETLVALYKGAKAFVSPSFYEGFGLTFIEAMASGCPVIGSTTPAVKEVVGDAGLLPDPEDIQGIGYALLKIVQNDILCTSLIEKGKKRAEKFDWNKFAGHLLANIHIITK